MNGNDYVKDYLAHYGVQGQKWGVRRAEDKLEIQKRKTKIAELKALEAQSKKETKEASKTSKEVTKEKIKNGKRIAFTVLTTGTLAALTVGSLIKRERKTWARGSKAVKKIMKKK